MILFYVDLFSPCFTWNHPRDKYYLFIEINETEYVALYIFLFFHLKVYGNYWNGRIQLQMNMYN